MARTPAGTPGNLGNDGKAVLQGYEGCLEKNEKSYPACKRLHFLFCPLSANAGVSMWQCASGIFWARWV